MLAAGPAAVATIEALDRTGLWGRLFPEWGAVRDLPPRDVVHIQQPPDVTQNAYDECDILDREADKATGINTDMPIAPKEVHPTARGIMAAREQAGLTQKQISDRCGIDDSSLSSFETGRSEPRLAVLEKLAMVYHVPLSYFFGQSTIGSEVVMWRNKPDGGVGIDQKRRAQTLSLEEWAGVCRELTTTVLKKR